MPANDPDNLRLNADGLAELVCDHCGGVFTQRVNDALERIARNVEGEVFCSRACAARKANERRPRRPDQDARQEGGCLFYEQASECPLLRAPILGTIDRRTNAFRPESERELDLCLEIVRASQAMHANAPPSIDGGDWSDERRDAWHEANGVHDLAERLLRREVARRNEST